MLHPHVLEVGDLIDYYRLVLGAFLEEPIQFIVLSPARDSDNVYALLLGNRFCATLVDINE